MKFINKDMIVLTAFSLVCLCGVLTGMESLCAASVGAIGGYVGARMIIDD